MISKITLNNVASYKHTTSLITNKYVNLIYGLNGVGKSTFSKYLRNVKDELYKDCSIEGLEDNHEILVYNQDFVKENFYESTQQNGIFTLSKENKEVEEKIVESQNIIKREEDNLKEAKEKKINAENKKNQKNEEIAKKVWGIKTEYSGGDRIFEYCLEGHKGKKESLFQYLISIQKSQQPKETIESLKIRLQSLSGENEQKYSVLQEINFNSEIIENDEIFSKQIVGSENSSVSKLISDLNNSDWVKTGLDYLSDSKDENEVCPFCQQKTITREFVKELKKYFDESYDNDLKYLKQCLSEYDKAIQELPEKAIYENNPKYGSYKKDFELHYYSFINSIKENRRQILEKIQKPSVSIELNKTSDILSSLNNVINKINDDVREHNNSIDRIDEVRSSIKEQFWQIMRWKYDSDIVSYNSDISLIDREIQNAKLLIDSCLKNINNQRKIITDLQKETVNIDEPIENINQTLIDIGMTEFKIEKDNEIFYKIKRGEDSDNIFKSLSEGEKMIISFLYFIELCRGKKGITDVEKKKIIVIDDPMSSLSNIHVYNIGRLIKNILFYVFDEHGQIKMDSHGNTVYPYEQIFVLTHSLYFFYEITDTNHKRRKNDQKCFRIIKNATGSEIKEMAYEEIQNDYQAYWSIVKDPNQPVALIANCMRNIIEYFFNFVEKTDLNNCFLKPELSNNRYQALYRYINRESHSIGQNISDFKELNYSDMKEAFGKLFIAAGYKEHYEKMSGENLST